MSGVIIGQVYTLGIDHRGKTAHIRHLAFEQLINGYGCPSACANGIGYKSRPHGIPDGKDLFIRGPAGFVYLDKPSFKLNPLTKEGQIRHVSRWRSLLYSPAVFRHSQV